jgi:general stress protein 13
MKMHYKKDDIVEGIITNIVAYGGFVYIDHETTGLIHISQLYNGFVKDIHRFLNIGQRVYCKVIEVDGDKKQLKLSLKNIPKNAKPRNQRRERLSLKPQSLLPQSKIGFSSLASQLPQWIKEKTEND